MKLFFREAGQGDPMIILHGLFGSSDNWYSLSKVFAEHFRVFTVDQRNHGQSPHSDEHDYKLLTQDLEDLIKEQNLTKPIVLGHSMGGKTAMNFALKDPASTGKLIVVDIMPKQYPLHHDDILEAMKSIDLAKLQSRGEAETLLQPLIPESAVRQFLLKNLTRNEQKGFEWKINLPALDANIERMGEGLEYEGQYTGPTLFIKGGKSNYFKPGDETAVAKYFPKAEWVTMDTGHWVQAEKPKEFADVVLKWLGKS
ncbi:MAG TPA: alpha/beta fold hydrolase [Cyclobacteriaceae bacterium]|nr:alpha/beta fold hydrolase [Cyclobacteriaceae bacterium]